MKETKEYTNKWKYISYSWIKRILLRWPYYPKISIDSMALTKFQWHFYRNKTTILKIHMEPQKTPDKSQEYSHWERKSFTNGVGKKLDIHIGKDKNWTPSHTQKLTLNGNTWNHETPPWKHMAKALSLVLQWVLDKTSKAQATKQT